MLNRPIYHLNPVLSLFKRWKQQLSMAQALLIIAFVLPSGPSMFEPTPPPPVPEIGVPAQISSGDIATEYSGCGGSYPSPVNSAYEQEIVEIVNSERISNGLPPLKRVALLDQAARYHAQDMQQDYYYDHKTYDRVAGNLSFVCYFDERVSKYYPKWSWLGENIAWGNSSPQSAMSAWMGSDGHRANILSTQFREIGVGYFSGNYWVQDFGQRTSIYPLIINNEAAETDTRNVSLYVYGSAAIWTEMRLRNDTLDWSNWVPFQNTVSWQLPDTVGDHTVSVELRRGTNTTSSNDSIYLSKTSPAQLGKLPEKLTFTYSTVERRFVPDHFSLQPLNIGGGSTLDWVIQSSGNWFGVTPGGGSVPDTFTITPQGTSIQPGTIYTGLVTVVVTSPDGAMGTPQEIEVSLNVIEHGFAKINMPFIVSTH